MRVFLAVLILAAVAALALYLAAGSRQPAGGARPYAEAPAGAIENDPNAPAAKRAPDEAEASVVGEWRSVDDPAFTRVFEANGSFYDTYNGDPAGAPGTWAFATDGSEELRLASEGDTMRFRVVAVTGATLQLVYLDGNGVHRYERVK